MSNGDQGKGNKMPSVNELRRKEWLQSLYDAIDYWYKERKANVLPANYVTKQPIEGWKVHQNNRVTKEQIEKWKKE